MSNQAITWAYAQELSPGAKFVLVALADLADEAHSCFPGQARIASMTGQSERTVRRQLAELESSGYLNRRRRFDSKGQRTSDRYVLPVHDVEVKPNRPKQPLATVTPGQTDHRPNPTALPDNHDSPTGHSVQVSLSEPPENPKNSPTKLAKDSDPRFVEFWSVYPKRVARPAAFKALAKVIAAGIPIETVIKGALRYRDDPKRDPDFTAHPATWLNAARWDDEPAQSSPGSKPRPAGWEFGMN